MGRRASLTASRGNAVPSKNAGVGKGHGATLLLVELITSTPALLYITILFVQHSWEKKKQPDMTYCKAFFHLA